MKHRFSRFIPKGGIQIYPNVWYIDFHDMEQTEVTKIRNWFNADPMHLQLEEHGKAIFKGQYTGVAYLVYVKKDDKWLGVLSAAEKLDNPHGYGQFDFHYVKWIFPEFQHTKYSRWASGDFMHMGFVSGAVHRFYSYFPADPGEHDTYYMNRVRQYLPCLGKRLPVDGLDVQKYIRIKNEFETQYGPYFLVEFNGDIYKQMDLRNYLSLVPNRPTEVVDRWIKEMDDAAAKVRETVSFTYE